jgi:hypothetical protein
MNPNQGNNNLFGLNNLDLSSLIASSGLNLSGMNGMNNVNGNQANNGPNQGGFGNIDMSMFQGMGLSGQGGQGMQNNVGLGLGMSLGQQNPQQAQVNPNVSRMTGSSIVQPPRSNVELLYNCICSKITLNF